ncbi:glycosyltransferase family 4 protein [Patiriisocius marinus]|uniref:Glycosyl transferase family 1 n=1 Tax=Patiriisocius marinus TaxID=1397112 RepID=A0A5J4J009_9FLAO|nr:glycosyltransferase family 4 protein [Patiriisocius marinus]GER59238.1 glycosyl transferase family 1 [Patiriisocius marinus]
MKKVLIICYYWPPAGGPGVQRWLKFVTYLNKFGIEPTVYIPENPNYPIIDEDLVNEVPKDITVLKFPIKEPYSAAKFISKKKTKTISKGIIDAKNKSIINSLLLFVRGNFFIPDARVAWVKPSVTYLENYLKDNPQDAIITTGPPHSLHLIGQKLQKTIGVKWIADFRDPWTTIHYHKSLQLLKISANKHKRLEREVLNSADHIIVTSPTTKREFKQITTKPISVITNGFEPDNIKQQILSSKFTLAHIGSLLTERNPINLWRVLAEMCQEDKCFATDLQLIFAGAISEEVVNSIKEYGLSTRAVYKGYVSHTEAKIFQRTSQVLLLLEIDSPETKAIIPGKLFEYLQANRPIVALGPKGSDINNILKTTNTGVFISSNEEENIKAIITKHYKAYKADNLVLNNTNISAYTRETLTENLAKLINDVTLK